MAHAKQASKRKRLRKSLPAFGVAGVSLAMAGGASATAPTGNVASQDTAPRPVITLGEEEISDVSLATFYVIDNENAGTFRRRIKLAQGGCGCGGGGCGGGGCASCAVSSYSGAASFGSYVTPPRYSKPTRKRRAGA
jgi:hypothetical protein